METSIIVLSMYRCKEGWDKYTLNLNFPLGDGVKALLNGLGVIYSKIPFLNCPFKYYPCPTFLASKLYEISRYCHLLTHTYEKLY